MKYRKFMFVLALLPVLAWAQKPVPLTPDSSRSAARDLDGTNASTRAVLLANCPKGTSEADWLKLMAKPVNASLYPLQITQAMLDTLPVKELDPRFQYVLVRH